MISDPKATSNSLLYFVLCNDRNSKYMYRKGKSVVKSRKGKFIHVKQYTFCPQTAGV